MPELQPDSYATLRKIAARYLDKERSGHTLEATALVHEAWLRIGHLRRDTRSAERSVAQLHFRANAAAAMRRILVDHARRRSAGKRGRRGPSLSVAIDLDLVKPAADAGFEMLEIDELLRNLAKLDARKARIAELRLFGGLDLDEVARTVDVARSTAAADWAVARAWLASRIGGCEERARGTER
jgi:RNA polymerase sigma-70 factor (ECF subfamily)